MQREQVASMNLVSLGYDRCAGILEVEFSSGAIYQYIGVPVTRHIALKESASKGAYFHKYIREQYGFKKIQAAHASPSTA